MRFAIIISLTLLITACFEHDEQLPKLANPVVTLNLDLDKNQAIFLDLKDIQAENEQPFQDWHLKFQNKANSWAIFLNTLSNVAIYNTRITQYDSITPEYNTQAIKWQLDIPTNNGSAPAIGVWGDFNFDTPKSYKDVYLIRWLSQGEEIIYKLQILDAKESEYHIRYGTLDDSEVYSPWIPKSEVRLHTYFSLSQDQILPDVEPPKTQWNICFTYLTDSISKYPNIPLTTTPNDYFGLYQSLVINQGNTSIYLDTSHSLDAINYFIAKDLSFVNIDEIHNVFYTYNDELSTHEVNQNLIIIVKEGDYYFALKPLDLISTRPKSISLTLEIKPL
ncbi:hypothetical protein N9J89_00105 [Bacteroidia bacterium]|jgi:hypothetical protein|nr:hypothetical protein [Bacteroidota bacterium]MDA8929937.1 hypothetical protein [Bacteroidia bacterium]MDA9110632.1 hypothetical protein [Bacteroidia bacterium]